MKPADGRSGWGVVGLLLGPSALLLPILGLYQSFDGLGHFFLHTLTGWDVALVLLLTATYYGRPWSRWDGLSPLSLALYALTPDFIYMGGPHHRDWMDVFLFHIALDEILPLAVGTLALLWVGLMRGYLRFRARVQEPGT